ncbi:MAG TPA: pilin [bacterium]|nr:pilin [bacterium]HPT30172.1 pilin [bacterium]
MKRYFLKLSLFFFLALFLAFPASGVLAACSFQDPSTAPLTPVCGIDKYQTTDVLLFCGGYPQGNQICCCDNVQTGSGGTGETNSSTEQTQVVLPVTMTNPLGGATIPVFIGRVINAVLGVIGTLALVMFIYGGFLWMMAGGNEQQVSKGKQILLWSTLGLVIIFSSYAIVRFVFSGILGV